MKTGTERLLNITINLLIALALLTPSVSVLPASAEGSVIDQALTLSRAERCQAKQELYQELGRKLSGPCGKAEAWPDEGDSFGLSVQLIAKSPKAKVAITAN